MNRKQLILLIVAGLVLGGAGYYLHRQQTTAWQSAGPGPKLLGEFPINDVAQVVIKQNQSELNLVKKDVWQVQERYQYPANFVEVSDLVRKLAELKPVQTQVVGTSQLARVELTLPGKGTNTGTLVELRDKTGKMMRSLLLGKKHLNQGAQASAMGGGGWPDGRYVLASNTSPALVAVVADPLSNVEPKPEAWLNKDFFKIEKLRSITVTPTNPAAAWRLDRTNETGEFKLADTKAGEELDATKVSGLATAFSSPTFVDVEAPTAKPETTGLDRPLVARCETFDGFVYALKIGKTASEDNYCLSVNVTADVPAARKPVPDEKPEDKTRLDKEFKDKTDALKTKLTQESALNPWVFRVSKWTLDSILKDRAQLMVEKKTEPAATNAPPIDLAPTGFTPVTIPPAVAPPTPVAPPPAPPVAHPETNAPVRITPPPVPPVPTPVAPPPPAATTNDAAAKPGTNAPARPAPPAPPLPPTSTPK